jgi:hypothetical protein
MIIRRNEGIAPNVQLASMRWNLALPVFGLITFTESLLLPVECRQKKFEKRFIRKRILT